MTNDARFNPPAAPPGAVVLDTVADPLTADERHALAAAARAEDRPLRSIAIACGCITPREKDNQP